MKRRNPSKENEARLMVLSDSKCCVCGKRGDHIHHVDLDSSNNNLENLALLCWQHHEEATRKSSMSKKLSPRAVLKYRELYYEAVTTKRKKALDISNTYLKSLNSEQLFQTVTDAVLLFELEKIKDEFYGGDWKEQEETLRKLNWFGERRSYRVSYEVLQFLEYVADYTRAGMPSGLAMAVYSRFESFFFVDTKKKKQTIELGELSNQIAFAMVYDSIIHSKNFTITAYGLLILKSLYIDAKHHKIAALTEQVLDSYKEILSLESRHGDYQEEAMEMVKKFKNDLETHGLAFPALPDTILQLMKASA